MIDWRGGSGLGAGFAIVVDIGKTLGKVTLWSRDGQPLDRQVRANEPAVVDGIRRLDVEGIGAWLVEALGKYRDEPVEAIVPVGHGAGVVALADDRIAVAPLDYEQAIPGDVLLRYRAERDAFHVTGSPALPDGLNLGAQLFWFDELYPEPMRDALLVPWAQYWAWFLSGRAVSEVTSLGCHTDLWAPDSGRFSPLAEQMGWARRFAPLVRAGSEVGRLRPSIAAATGLSLNINVLAGLHDSNAALLAARGFDELANEECTVLSTGTWFVAMRSPGSVFFASSLPPDRDCLINIDAYGRRIPSARFMGGREIETVIELDTRQVDIKPDQPALLAAVPSVLVASAMLMPTLAPGTGPFPNCQARWLNRPGDWYQRRAAACLYAALVADASLDLIGSRDRLLIEGRFAEAMVFARALATLRPDTQVFTPNARNDVSFGAIRLLDPTLRPPGELTKVQPLDEDLTPYRERWYAELEVAA
jgi:sugar (pentulose or hexulose) kinase